MRVALTRQDIARAGLKLLNKVGLNGLTLRLIADELGVKAPALYWHMKNKQELLDEMATQMYREYAAHAPRAGDFDDWPDLFTQAARSTRQMLLTYRDGAKVFSGTMLTEPTLATGHVATWMAKLGTDPERADHAMVTLYSYIIGFTIEEQAVYPMPGERDPRYVELADSYREAGATQLEMAVADGMIDDYDKRFAEGLRIVIAGIREYLKD